jgi:hypothetical protein
MVVIAYSYFRILVAGWTTIEAMDVLRALYGQFDPARPLEVEETDLYVNWQEDKALAPDDIKKLLARGIARSEIPVCRMFTGHRGVGKTTELKRIKSMLEDGEAGPPVFVSMLRAEQWMDLQDVEAPDIVFQSSGSLWTT